MAAPGVRTHRWSAAAGVAPDDGRGTVVVAGHVDTAEDGPGIFAELATMSAGDQITITTSDERVHAYTVTELHSYAEEQLPPELFSRNGPRRLVLITCTGPFDDRTVSYTRNRVVVAAAPAKRAMATTSSATSPP